MHLWNNEIGEAGAKNLAGVLPQCPALVHLNLNDNRIGEGGAESLAGVLTQCAALAHLELASNAIGPAGAKSLAGVLAQCAALTHLDLSYNGMYGAAVGKRCCELRGVIVKPLVLFYWLAPCTACSLSSA